MERNLEKYWKSISHELGSTKDRIRDLIGDAHWQTDGEAKEAVFRNVLSNHIAETVRVGRGFVSYPEAISNPDQPVTSTQLDVLITHKRMPTLFKDADLTIVTPDAVVAIVEVKTKLDRSEPAPDNNKSLRGALIKLAKAAEEIRKNDGTYRCQAGLFVFEAPGQRKKPTADYDLALLKALQEAAEENELRTINWVAWGPHFFARYWKVGELSETGGFQVQSRWHTYYLEDLAQGYFLSNIVLETLDKMEQDGAPPSTQKMWYPIEGGKRIRRRSFIELNGVVRSDWED